MTHTAAAFSTSATFLSPFSRGVNQWSRDRPRAGLVLNWGKFRSHSSFFPSVRSKELKIAASVEAGNNGGVPEVSEGEWMPRSYSWPDNKRPRVCILGGGFGGLYTALRLESLVWPNDKKPQVILVDQSERFVFKPMLYELLSGEVDSWEIAPRFSNLLLNTSVQFVQDRVKILHPCDHLGLNGLTGSGCGGTVHLESGLLIEYDWLVLCLGAEPKLDLVPGAVEYALPFSSLEDANKVDEMLRTLVRMNFGKDSLISVAIVGCGYSGVELAATVSERLQDKGLVQAINVESSILPNAPPGNREAALKVRLLNALLVSDFYRIKVLEIFPVVSHLSLLQVLSSRNVQVLLGYFVRGIAKAGKITTSDELKDVVAATDLQKLVLELQPTERGSQNKFLEADLVLWTVGSKPLLPQLEPSTRAQELPLNGRGQTETDETLRVKGHPRIFAVGDSAAVRDSKGNLLPATAQVAFQQADFAGWNLWAAINDRPLLPFRFQNLGEMMVLGRNDAAISPSFIEGLTLDGPIGHTARKLAYLIRLPTDEHRVKVGISWLAKSAVDSVASLQDTLAKVLSGS